MKIMNFQGQYRWLSNFWECPIAFNGVLWPSAEHAYQAQKTLSPDEQRRIRDLPNPGAAKRAGRFVEMRPDWERVKDKVMLEIVTAKLMQNSGLAALLLSTGDAELVEGNHWHDNYWGHCTCARCLQKPALNKLGQILMKIRKQLQDVQALKTGTFA